MTKVLITGSNGFVGKHVVKAFVKTGYEVIGMGRESGNVADEETWDNFPDAAIVIHLAARSFVPDSWMDIPGFIHCNVLGITGALNYCRSRNARLVYLSSYLYGNPVSLPISEEADIMVNNPYALSKKIAEDVCQFFSESFGIQVTILRPFNVYGIGQSERFLIPSLISQINHGNRIHVKDLEPKRDYLYIDDLVSAIIRAVDYRGKAFNIFNIGSGVSYSVQELIQIIQDHKKTDCEVVSDVERRKNEIMDTIADINKAQSQLLWEPRWTLSDGIKQMLLEYE